MEKKVINWHGRKYYLLGSDKWGRKHYLEESSFDCGWYWGVGYIESFTNNRNPERSRDIQSHTHWSVFFDDAGRRESLPTPQGFRAILPETPLNDREIWTLSELMKSLYVMREYSDAIYCGGAHVTSNPCKETIKDEAEYKRINETVIPALLEAVYDLLSPER